ncbi:Ubiquitin carboxyl-terminal hydrolase 34 [Zalerion maritima]|uniref:Ubiquitin carboxyl-terminal hydrolase 34 n=1 Tax=Zalerion maritima TaxID=339359 RepID=A0AAD5RNE6_9PEZI|nr:Ubiquitin carboxyl-terminal hydrolase 34 [Zalerion maritima]
MDHNSSTPEPRQRAVSSEPCPSVRPNPFDNDESARKRRRTSLSSSQSVSADSATHLESSEAAGAAEYNSAPGRDETVDTVVDSAEAMKIDPQDDPGLARPRSPTRPRTPTNPPPSAPGSSKVTLNLRSARPSVAPTSPYTASPNTPSHSPVPAPTSTTIQASVDPDDIHVSVEESEVDPPVRDPESDTISLSPSSSLSTGGPEVIAIPSDDEDDDVRYSDDQTSMSLLADIPADPGYSFPYRDAHETQYDAMVRIHTYLMQPIINDDVFRTLEKWLMSYIDWARNVGYDITCDSLRDNHEVWSNVPDMVSGLLNRKIPIHRSSEVLHSAMIDFLCCFTQFTIYLVRLDLETLRRTLRDGDLATRPPELHAPNYILRVNQFGKMNGPSLYNAFDDDAALDPDGKVLERMQSGVTFQMITEMCDLVAALAPRFPKAIESMTEYCHLVSSIARDAQYKYENQISYGLDQDKMKSRLVESRKFFDKASEILKDVVDKYSSGWAVEAATMQVVHLTEICNASLFCMSDEVHALLREFAHNSPVALTAPELPDVVAHHWRFDMWIQMIKSGQMQLRVCAVTKMCSDLVNFWKRYQETFAEGAEKGLLLYFSDYLLKSTVIEYLLGPTCHPEITSEAGNIIGFLAVTKTFPESQADLFWQTITTSQDPRVCDALIRMMTKIMNLFSHDIQLYLVQKMENLPLEGFTHGMREFASQTFKHVYAAAPQYGGPCAPNFPPFAIAFRLLREASVPPFSHPDIQTWASQKFRELFQDEMNNVLARRSIIELCLNFIEKEPTTSLGSLWGMATVLLPGHYQDLPHSPRHEQLPQILVSELEYAIQTCKGTAAPQVLSSGFSRPRKDMICQTILRLSALITPDLGARLWSSLVGCGASCQEDRNVAWTTLNQIAKRTTFDNNAFLRTSCTSYFPSLEPQFFCPGALEFLLSWVLPRAKASDTQALEDPADPCFGGLEQLWRMILCCPADTVEGPAIKALVNEIYIDNPALRGFQSERTRKIHLGLVNRCLQQLKSAAQKLKGFSDGTSSGEDEPMVIVATDEQVLEQELIFVRSLVVLREFMEAYQTKPEFSSPDLRAMMPDSPDDSAGDPAELKYQSFDGNDHTDVLPLDVGKHNTAASLLASLKEVTGFDNYRLFYRGAPLQPSEREICRSLDELRIHNGIILVKKVSSPGSPPKMRPGVSTLEMEVLSHFQELWEYLSMGERFAQEIYHFLVRLPPDASMIAAFDSPSIPYREVFELGHPFKSLYAVHVLEDYLEGKKRATILEQRSQSPNLAVIEEYPKAALRALTLVVAAFSNAEVIDSCPTVGQRRKLCTFLVTCYFRILKVPTVANSEVTTKLLDSRLVDRLVEIALSAISDPLEEESAMLAARVFDIILDSHHASENFRRAFWSHPQTKPLLAQLLIEYPGQPLRQAAKQCILRQPAIHLRSLAEFLWPILLEFLKQNGSRGCQIEELLGLTHRFFNLLLEADSDALDLKAVMRICTDILLRHNSIEDFTRPSIVDKVCHGLVSTLLLGLRSSKCPPITEVFERGTGTKLFWKQLFPRLNRVERQPVIISTHTRSSLCEIIFQLSRQDTSQFKDLVKCLRSLTPFCEDDADLDTYIYELPPLFEREKHIRAPCGYVGLKNLSNTCYFNSLLTQLFMNQRFRQFMFNVNLIDPEGKQELLSQTQRLFGFLQKSVRRFYDPAECVASIRTYEDTQIDIHNQMDVDEFYNLLFDRWEGQLTSSDEKREFRSLYGGQLVQQVKSKECEHVSERLEPFAAIQCDIKGKTNLQESLQAYVDGEIMEGDNKYKCSTCDRHVDAVKRACLKEIPDNLIFHLKRFEFNLRTMTRSKINDHFAFPTTIDMRPFTVEHLEGLSEDADEDVFELVGVLVHAGTAESGHYYSYIRPRPSVDEGWVEFNDDVVAEWDPQLMESMCFGGYEYRTNFDTPSYDKSWNAYMLFYQRSSSLKRDLVRLKQAGSPEVVKPRMPEDLDSFIHGENVRMLRRHCLFDPNHVQWATQVLSTARFMGNTDGCSANHVMENIAMQMALGHLDQVASRAKDTPDFVSLILSIRQLCQGCLACSFAVYHYFHKFPVSFRNMLQKNPDALVRGEVGALLLLVADQIKQRAPDKYNPPEHDGEASSDSGHDSSDGYQELPVLEGMLDILKKVFQTFYQNLSLRAWQEVFGFMVNFGRLGREERAMMLDADFLHKLLCIIVVDPGNTSVPPLYHRLHTAIMRRMPTRPVVYDGVYALIDLLLGEVDPRLSAYHAVQYAHGRFHDAQHTSDPIPLTSTEHELIFSDWKENQGNVLVDKLGTVGQNPACTDPIVVKLVRSGPEMDVRVFQTLKVNIQGTSPAGLAPAFLRMAHLYCRFSKSEDRIAKLIAHISRQCLRGLANTEGYHYFNFHRLVFDGERLGTGEPLDEIRLQGLSNIPNWVPGLLAYYDGVTRNCVDDFLAQRIFAYGTTPAQATDEEEATMRAAMYSSARRLARSCLEYLHRNYVLQRNHLTKDCMTSITKVLHQCEAYFHILGEENVDEFNDFHNLRTAVMDALGPLTVEELEEDASEWEQSVGSSEPMDSLTDLNRAVAGDDAELS